MRKIIYFISFIAVLGIESCTQLDSEMYDTINPSIFPKTEADAEALVNANAYAPFRSGSWGTGLGLFNNSHTGLFVSTDMTTDQGDCRWGDSYWSDVINMNFRPNSSDPTQFYGYLRDISKMTLTLKTIKEASIPEDSKKRMEAEIHCARGWLGYILYDLYGGIPIATEEQLEDPSIDVSLPRLSNKEMVTYIENELRSAIDSKKLADNYLKGDSNYGRFTNALAYTVLMKLYMHEKMWKKAEECGRELMDGKYGFALVNEYKDIFSLKNEKNKEVIWAAVCDRNTVASMWLAHVLPNTYPTENPNIAKWGGYRMPWAFYNQFDKNDKRLEVLIGEYSYTDSNGQKVTLNESNPSEMLKKGALPIKYGEDPEATGAASQLDWIVYRYADILTMLSEAIVHQYGVTSEAVDLLNKIHVRAGLPAFSLSDFTDEQSFLDKLLLERGKEFWFEGVRRSDLIRHGKYIEFARLKGSTTAQPYMVLMPIPQWAVNEAAKSNLDIQNPGY